MVRRKKLSVSRETVRVLGAGPLSRIAGGWPTATGAMDGQCTGKHSTCIEVPTEDSCFCDPSNNSLSNDCNG